MIKDTETKPRGAYESPCTTVLEVGISQVVCTSVIEGDATIDDFVIDPIVDVDWLL